MALVNSAQLFQSIEKALTQGTFAPLYFLHGEESYLVQQAVQYLKTCSLHGGIADFNFTQFYAADVEASRVRDEVETLPMMSARRVVLVREAQDFKDAEWDELEPLFLSPVESTVFIIACGRVDRRKKYVRWLTEKAVSCEFKRPFENQIPGWIRQIGKAHNLDIDDEAQQLLHRLVGNQLTEIEAEIRKLVEFVGARQTVRLEDVAQCVSKRREENVFDLAASLASGDRSGALLQLADLLDAGQNEVGIVALVARHIRILLQLKQGQQLGLSGPKLAAFAQVAPYFMPDYVNQGRLWSARKLEQVLLILMETDRALKSSPLSTHIWLENMILKTSQLRTAPMTYARAET